MSDTAKNPKQNETEVTLVTQAKKQFLQSEVRIKHGDMEIRCAPKDANEIKNMLEAVLTPVL